MLFANIYKLCEKNGITVTQLEKLLGFGNGTIHAWRESSPSLAKAEKVADFFGITVDKLSKEEIL